MYLKFMGVRIFISIEKSWALFHDVFGWENREHLLQVGKLRVIFTPPSCNLA